MKRSEWHVHELLKLLLHWSTKLLEKFCFVNLLTVGLEFSLDLSIDIKCFETYASTLKFSSLKPCEVGIRQVNFVLVMQILM